MSLKTLYDLPQSVHKFENQAREYERRTSISMAYCVAVVFSIYAILFLPIGTMEDVTPQSVVNSIVGMVVIILVSLAYAYLLKHKFRPDQLSKISWWGFTYHTFLIGTIFFLWLFGNNVSITPVFIIIICLGFTSLHIRQYIIYTTVTLIFILVTISLVEFDYFWFLEFVILYLFAVSLHVFHVGQQCKLFEYQNLIEADRNIDSLTGLLNRRALEEVYSMRMNSSLKTAAIMLDLDHFKNINDTFGHAIGDRALVHTAEVLRGIFRKDDLVARLGGDEFFILLQLGNGAEEIMDRKILALLQNVPILYKSRSHEVAVTYSVGACLCTDGSAPTLDQLITRADSAMYHIKQSGRNAALLRVDGKPEKRISGNQKAAHVVEF